MSEPVDVSKKHFYISLVKSGIRLLACYAMYSAGTVLIEGGNGGALLVVSAFGFAVAEILGIVEEL
jgi:hypothetical protein